METNECLDNNGGCWRDEKTNITACKVPTHLHSPTSSFNCKLLLVTAY